MEENEGEDQTSLAPLCNFMKPNLIYVHFSNPFCNDGASSLIKWKKKADLYSKKLSTVLYSFELRLKFAPTSTMTEMCFNVLTRSNTFK